MRDSDALIVVDVQNDFCPGGALAVLEGDQVIPVINRMVPFFPRWVFTRDWHPPDHVSFSIRPEFRDGSWPPHCVQHTPGAQFHPDLYMHMNAIIVSKGCERDREEYSAFQTKLDLAAYLRGRGVKRVCVAGLATDYCVRHTALDGRRHGFEVFLVEDAVRGVAEETTVEALQEMDDVGVVRIRSSQVVGS